MESPTGGMFSEEESNIPNNTVKLMNLLSLFGVVPWYDFKKHKLYRPKTFKCYSTILTIIMTTLCLHLVHLRYELLYDTISVPMILDVTIELEALVSTIVTIIVTTYCNTKYWATFYKSIDLVDTSEELSCKVSDNVFVLKYGRAIFWFGNAYILSLHQFNRVVLEEAGHVSEYYTSTFVLTYYQFLIAFTILYTTALIKPKYILITKLFNECDPQDVNFISNVKKIRKMCFQADDAVQLFNRLCGWPLLMIFLGFLFVMVGSSIGAVMKNFIWMNHVYNTGYKSILLNVGYVLQSAVWLTAIIFCCDSVVSEADDLLLNCHRLEHTLPSLSKELEILESLKKLITNKSPKLTAAGFFEIRRSTLLSLLSTTTTYFIVALQFNSLK